MKKTKKTKKMKKMKMTALLFAVLCLTMTGAAYAGGDAAAGKSKAASCMGCHGPNGEGMGLNPKIVGLPEQAFVQAMVEYKTGKRPHMGMQALSKGLSEQDFADLAAYYAGL